MSMEEPILNTQNSELPSAVQKSENKKSLSKKQRLIRECYPESMEEIWAKGTQWVTPRTKQRQTRRAGVRKTGEDKVCTAETVSISDGCIENRNRVLQGEMNMQEVRRIMEVGKRLGFQLENNGEEIQSRLLEAENRETVGRRDDPGA
ncbi:hypothetical protein SLA2020_191690 [Shorea laevis]